MKNIVFGLIGFVIIFYTTAISLGIYNTYIRKNELENSLAHVMESVMEKYYMAKKEGGAHEDAAALSDNNEKAENEVINELRVRLINRKIAGSVSGKEADISAGDHGLTVDVKACDMEKGILGVSVVRKYRQVNGKIREMRMEKVLIAE